MKKILMFGAILAFILTSCSDDSPNATNDNNNGTNKPGFLSVQINGDGWQAQQNSIVCIYTKDPQLGDILDIAGTALDGSQITLAVSGIEPGVYKFNTDNMEFDGIVGYTYKKDGQIQNPFLKTSQVTITAHDAANKTVTGTFQFKTDNDEFTGVNGSFGNMVYTEK